MKKDSKRVVIIKERLALQLLTRVIGRSLQNILHQFVQISCGKLTLSGSVEKNVETKLEAQNTGNQNNRLHAS